VPAITTNDLKNGITLELDNGLFQVVEFQHVKPGKGGAFVRTKLRNVKTGNVFDRTFNAGVRVEQALLEKKDMQFLYRDGDEYVFMDTENYDQIVLDAESLGDATNYLTQGTKIQVQFFEGAPIGVELPPAVELTVVETTPELKGATASNSPKPAKLETGVTVQVPPFVKEGDRIRVDPSKGVYLERVK